jgi:hypothetical protein
MHSWLRIAVLAAMVPVLGVGAIMHVGMLVRA